MVSRLAVAMPTNLAANGLAVQSTFIAIAKPRSERRTCSAPPRASFQEAAPAQPMPPGQQHRCQCPLGCLYAKENRSEYCTYCSATTTECGCPCVACDASENANDYIPSDPSEDGNTFNPGGMNDGTQDLNANVSQGAVFGTTMPQDNGVQWSPTQSTLQQASFDQSMTQAAFDPTMTPGRGFLQWFPQEVQWSQVAVGVEDISASANRENTLATTDAEGGWLQYLPDVRRYFII